MCSDFVSKRDDLVACEIQSSERTGASELARRQCKEKEVLSSRNALKLNLKYVFHDLNSENLC